MTPRLFVLIISATLASAAYAMPGMGGGDKPAGGDLPPGHPPIGAAATMPAATSAAAVKGSISLTVVSGTKGAPAVGKLPVMITLYHQGRILDQRQIALNDKGKAVIADLPVGIPCQAVIQTNYANMPQSMFSPLLEPANPNIAVEMKVYEPTANPPEWEMPMRHVLISEVEGGLQVTEMVRINNPTDRIFVGRPDASGATATVAFDLPAEAAQITLGEELPENLTRVSTGKIVTQLPLDPGVTQMRWAYILPTKNGAATLNIAAPSHICQMIVSAPEHLVADAKGLQNMGQAPMGPGGAKVTMFSAKEMKKGDVVSLAFGNAGGIAAADASGGSASQNIVAIGLISAAVLGIGAFAFLKPKKAKA